MFNSSCRLDSCEELKKDPAPRNPDALSVRASPGLQDVLKAPQGVS